MKNYAIIIEVRGGSDKGEDGHRRDTFPILEGIKKQGFDGEVIFYDENEKEKIFNYIVDKADIVIGRINPGNLTSVDEYFQFLNKLSKNGVIVNTHPDVMVNLNFKDILVKLKDTDFLPGDMDLYFYTNYDDFKEKFPAVLKKYKKRVLKQNYGSTGEGVFLVELLDNGAVIVTEAVNNSKTTYKDVNEMLKKFKDYFKYVPSNEVYFKGKQGLVDVKYLPRIVEGEIRVLLIGNKIHLIVHKLPKKGGFSATLFSGAKYQSYSPTNPKWSKLVNLVAKNLFKIEKYLNNKDYPLIWTMDFILDTDENEKDIYVLSEINCSCVGITTDLYLADIIGEQVRKLVLNKV